MVPDIESILIEDSHHLLSLDIVSEWSTFAARVSTKLCCRTPPKWNHSSMLISKRIIIGTRCIVKFYASKSTFEFFWYKRLSKFLSRKTATTSYFQISETEDIDNIFTMNGERASCVSFSVCNDDDDGDETFTSRVAIEAFKVKPPLKKGYQQYLPNEYLSVTGITTIDN